jgi:RNA polymerase sigma-70 factor (ECF subfamily)
MRDVEQFSEVFTAYHERVLMWCYRIARNRDDADDLAQEVFLKAWRRRHTFRGDSSVSTWLYSITRNHCITAMARRRQCAPLDSVERSQLRDLKTPAPDKAAERADLSCKVMYIMHRALEPLEQRVMTMHYADEESLGEITQELHLENPSGAKAYIVNGRRKLRGALERRGLIAA